jgi:hypothetical protein
MLRISSAQISRQTANGQRGSRHHRAINVAPIVDRDPALASVSGLTGEISVT